MTMHTKRHKVKLKCLVCNADKLILDEDIAVLCDVCGQAFVSDTTCANGHHICHMCRQKVAREKIIEYCLASKQTNPYALMQELMRLPDTAMHGPEHHLLLTAALLTALCIVKDRDDLADLLEQANERSLQVPGGACGNWGVCGAAIGAGIFSSIVIEASPYAESEWKSCGQLTAKCAAAISEQGGPRCCKRDSFTAFLEAMQFCNEELQAGFLIPEEIECEFFINNEECKGKRCRFFPTRS